MKFTDVLLIMLSVALSSTSQVILKLGMNAPSSQAAISGGSGIAAAIVAILGSPWIL